MSEEAEQLDAAARCALTRDFGLFLHHAFDCLNGGTEYRGNWHIELMAEYLRQVEDGGLRRLIINMPPRYLKSLCVSVAWPAWLLGRRPQRRIIVASYASSLSLKHSLDCRHLVGSDWYSEIYPDTRLMKGQNEKQKFATTAHGFRMATSVGGAVTGEGGDILIVDDPLNPLQAESKLLRTLANRWFEHTFSSRLNDKRHGAIVVVMQRLHPQDLSGFLLAKPGWELLELPAIAPVTRYFLCDRIFHRRNQGAPLHALREDGPMLERVKREMGSYAFAAQYQQQPLRREGGMVNRDWFGRYDQNSEARNQKPEREKERGKEAAPALWHNCQNYLADSPRSGSPCEIQEDFAGQLQTIQSWDTAIKAGSGNDPSVCLTFEVRDGRFYLRDVLRQRLEYPQLRRALLEQAKRWNPQGILVEDKASGQSLLQDLRQSTGLPVIACKPVLDKVTRFAAVTPLIEAGRLWLPLQAPWLAEFEQEILGFPEVAHDDQVDALSQFLNWWRMREMQGEMRVRRV